MRGAVILRFGLLLHRCYSAAELHYGSVPEPCFRVVSPAVPAARAQGRRADQRRLAHRKFDAANQLSGFRVNILSEVDGLAKPPNVLKLPSLLAQHKHEAALVQVDEQVV